MCGERKDLTRFARRRHELFCLSPPALTMTLYVDFYTRIHFANSQHFPTSAKGKLFLLQHVHNNSSRFNCLHSKFALCCTSNTYWSCEYFMLFPYIFWFPLAFALCIIFRAQCNNAMYPSSNNFTRRLLKSWKFNLPTNCYGDISLPLRPPEKYVCRMLNIWTFYPSRSQHLGVANTFFCFSLHSSEGKKR